MHWKIDVKYCRCPGSVQDTCPECMWSHQCFTMCYFGILLRSLVKFANKEHIEKGMESDDTRVGVDSELEFSELTQSTEMRELSILLRVRDLSRFKDILLF